MTCKLRIVAAAVVVLMVCFLVLPGFWTWLPPTATAVVPSSWPHNKDMPIEIRLSAWHSNYEFWEVRFGILPERGRVQPQSPPLYPLVLDEGQHHRTWNRLGHLWNAVRLCAFATYGGEVVALLRATGGRW
jgi:hypothetical protein